MYGVGAAHAPRGARLDRQTEQYWDILKLRMHYDQYLKPMVVDSQYNLLGGLEHFSIVPYIGNNHPN